MALDATSKTKVIGPYFTSHTAFTSDQLINLIYHDTIALYDRIGFEVLMLMSDCGSCKPLPVIKILQKKFPIKNQQNFPKLSTVSPLEKSHPSPKLELHDKIENLLFSELMKACIGR